MSSKSCAEELSEPIFVFFEVRCVTEKVICLYQIEL